MSEARRALRQALILGALGILLAAAVHLPLIQRFVRGEFRETFFRAAEYPGIRLITLEEAEDLWRAGEAVFFDARRPDLYREGHVPSARNFPSSETERALPAEILDLPRQGMIVVYCEGGDCQSSLLQAKRLSDEGFQDIRVMTGGWEEWKRAGLPAAMGDDQD